MQNDDIDLDDDENADVGLTDQSEELYAATNGTASAGAVACAKEGSSCAPEDIDRGSKTMTWMLILGLSPSAQQWVQCRYAS